MKNEKRHTRDGHVLDHRALVAEVAHEGGDEVLDRLRARNHHEVEDHEPSPPVGRALLERSPVTIVLGVGRADVVGRKSGGGEPLLIVRQPLSVGRVVRHEEVGSDRDNAGGGALNDEEPSAKGGGCQLRELMRRHDQASRTHQRQPWKEGVPRLPVMAPARMPPRAPERAEAV